ncbi:MAG TPA: hypothetical protein VFA85_06905 [Terriglobales bacterium]|nr:hypothetical protein [Terriglobales bacterium]
MRCAIGFSHKIISRSCGTRLLQVRGKKKGPLSRAFVVVPNHHACGGGVVPGFVFCGVVGGVVFGVVVPGVGEVGFPAGGVVPGVVGVVEPGVVESGVVESGDPGFVGVVCGVVSFGLLCGVGVVLVFGVVPGVLEFGEFGFSLVGAGVGATVPDGCVAVPGAGVVVWPGVVVCPGAVP